MSKVVHVESLVLLCSCCCSCLGLQEVSDLLLMRGEGVIDNIVHFRIQIFFFYSSYLFIYFLIRLPTSLAFSIVR